MTETTLTEMFIKYENTGHGFKEFESYGAVCRAWWLFTLLRGMSYDEIIYFRIWII